MLRISVVISLVILLKLCLCDQSVNWKYADHNDLLEASNHGHDTGVSNKEKRCHELQLPYHNGILGTARNSKLLPSTLTRRDVLSPCANCKQMFCQNSDCKLCRHFCDADNAQIAERSADDIVRLASRFKPDHEESRQSSGLTEAQERYYTVGSFGPGPKQSILAKLLNIHNVQLDRLIILAKNKSKNKAAPIPYPVVIDTAHVFTTSSDKPAEIGLELHNVKGDQHETIDNLTKQLNKELDAAIEKKKEMRGDSHLTPEEIDRIIEHVVDQKKARAKVNGKEIVGDRLEETSKLREVDGELDDDLEGLKKKKHKKNKKHGFNDNGDIVGLSASPNEEEIALKHQDELLESIHNLDNTDLEALKLKDDVIKKNPHNINAHADDDSLLGTFKKGKGYGMSDGYGYGKGKGKGLSLLKGKGKKGKGGYYRENEDEDFDSPINHEDVNEMEEDIDDTLSNKHEEGVNSPGVDDDINADDSLLGTKKKIKGGYGKGGYGKMGHGKYKGKKGKYRENDNQEEGEFIEGESNLDDHNLGSAQPNYPSNYQSAFPLPNQQNPKYPPASNYPQYEEYPSGYEGANVEYSEQPAYPPVESIYQATPSPYMPPESDSQYYYQTPQMPEYQQSHSLYQQPENMYKSQPQPSYQQPQMIYDQPQVGYEQPQNQYAQPQELYKQPQQEYYQQPSPSVYQPPTQAVYQQAQEQPQPQAAYGSAKNYKSVEPEQEEFEDDQETPQVAPVDEDAEVGSPAVELPDESSRSPLEHIISNNKNIPQDPTLKANWFENEYHRLKDWVSDNMSARHSATLKPRKEDLVDKFTKVIEKDLTEGKNLTTSERKSLDKRIAKLVRDNLNDDDPKMAESKAHKKLDKLEELVEEEADADDDRDTPVGSVIDDLKSRMAQEKEEVPPGKKAVQRLKHKLRASLDNLINDKPVADRNLKLIDVNKPKSANKPLVPLTNTEKKPMLDLQHIVDDLKSMPQTIADSAGKLADMIKSEKTPKLGSRSSMADEPVVGEGKPEEKTANGDETVGCLDDLLDKKGDEGEWHIIPEYGQYGDHYGHHDSYDHGHHHHDGYHGHDNHHHGYNDGQYGDDHYDQYREAEKKDTIIENLDKLLHPKHHQKLAEDTQRSDEEGDEPSEPHRLSEIVRNLEENLKLPTLPPLPSLRQTERQHFKHHNKPLLPKLEVNDEPIDPEQQEFGRPLPENPQADIPQFQDQRFRAPLPPPPPPRNPQEMPAPNMQFPQMNRHFAPPSQLVGAIQQNRPVPLQDLSQFGKLVPEALHDRHLRDVSEHMKKHRMYFVGDGIKLPLHMHKHEDGTFHLSVDLEKLCKCNVSDCATDKTEAPKFMSTHSNANDIDMGDAPLQMVPNHITIDDEADRELAKRSPRFDYYDFQPQSADSPLQDNEAFINDLNPMRNAHTKEFEKKLDNIISPIQNAYKEELEKKLDNFNEDIKEYYANEEMIKNKRLNKQDLQSCLETRISLLSKILSMLKDIVIED